MFKNKINKLIITLTFAFVFSLQSAQCDDDILVQAVQNEDIGFIKYYLETTSERSFSDEDSETQSLNNALIRAAQNNQIEIIWILLNHGVDPIAGSLEDPLSSPLSAFANSLTSENLLTLLDWYPNLHTMNDHQGNTMANLITLYSNQYDIHLNPDNLDVIERTFRQNQITARAVRIIVATREDFLPLLPTNLRNIVCDYFYTPQTTTASR